MKKSGIILSVIWLPILLIAMLVLMGCQSTGGAGTAATPTGAKTDVEITSPTPTETASATETPTETAKPITGVFKRRTQRDPFIPVVGVQPTETAKGPAEVIRDTPEPGTTKVRPTQPRHTPKPQDQLISGDQVGVSVSGIVMVGGVYKAILKGAGGSYMVGVGERVGDWTVASITAKQVILKAPGYRAKLDLPTQQGGGPKVPGPGPGPKAPELPPPPR